jgi:hypothetical protein
MPDHIAATQILAMKRPSELFSMELSTLEYQLKKLRSTWHPDKHPTEPLAKDVFHKITELYEQAFKMLSGKIDDNELVIECRNVKRYFKYALSESTEFGMQYHGNGSLVLQFAKQNGLLASNYMKNLSILEKAVNSSKRVGESFSAVLPDVVERVSSDDFVTVLSLKLPQNVVPLSMMLKHYKGKVPAVHAAWMTSRMLNQACLYHYAGIVNNTFSLQSFFVNPETHEGFDYGGLMYGCPDGGKLVALTRRSFGLYPGDALAKKQGSSRIDSILIRNTLSMLLGDPTGVGLSLQNNVEIPEVLRKWVRETAPADVFQDFKDWEQRVLPAAFGPRKFARTGITAIEILTQGM